VLVRSLEADLPPLTGQPMTPPARRQHPPWIRPAPPGRSAPRRPSGASPARSDLSDRSAPDLRPLNGGQVDCTQTGPMLAARWSGLCQRHRTPSWYGLPPSPMTTAYNAFESKDPSQQRSLAQTAPFLPSAPRRVPDRRFAPAAERAHQAGQRTKERSGVCTIHLTLYLPLGLSRIGQMQPASPRRLDDRARP
jgi:hypothetical protein